MRVFISWSKDPSQKIASILKERIPSVLHNIEPWMSEKDISAIICLDNRRPTIENPSLTQLIWVKVSGELYDHCRRLLSFRRCRIRS